MSNDLITHGKALASDVQRGKTELTDDGGIFISGAGVVLRGTYFHEVNGKDLRIDKNLLTTEGLNYLLTTGLKDGTKAASWYLSIFAANYTPVAALTAASYPATASEIVSATEGYSESTRQVWTPGAVASGAVDNLAAKANFTIVTAGSLTVNGAALVSEASKGAVTGTLVSATKFAASRVLYNTDVFTLGYNLQLTSA